MANFTIKDDSGNGFIDVQALQASNSKGCRCCVKCAKGTGDDPCKDCTYSSINCRNDGTMGCDEFSCQCASAVAYKEANPEEFAGL